MPGERRRNPPLGEGVSLDDLQHQRVDAVHVLDAVNGGDVRMVQGRQEPCFPLEPARRSGSLVKRAGNTLIATSRPSAGSRARYTSPMPPTPSRVPIV